MQKVLVIVPTYNERENIGTLIEHIFAVSNDLHVLVVDDESPDRTADLVREKQEVFGNNRLCLLVREGGKRGRGSACMDGFRFASDHGYYAVIEMDADLSHDPSDIPFLLNGLDHADVVIGSKYIPGGRIIGWEWYRHVLSRCANHYAGCILRLPIRDYTNGYRCYGPQALAVLPELRIDGTGFTVIPQMSYELYRKGLRLAEIPITFTNRRRGKSNMSMQEIIESFLAILKIRSHHLHRHVKQGVKFFVTGITNVVIDISLLALFVEVLHVPLKAAAPIDTALVMINVFLMNKYWTFRSVNKNHIGQGIKFTLVYGSSFILVNAITLVLSEVFLVWYIPSRLIAIAICAVWNYTWLHLKVFND